MIAVIHLPVWITLPFAAIAMVSVAVHLLIVERRQSNPVRRRIRMVNGWLMLISIPLIAAGISYINPDVRPRMFVIVWLMVIVLVSISLLLAAVDIANTMVAARRGVLQLRSMKKELERHLPAERNAVPGTDCED